VVTEHTVQAIVVGAGPAGLMAAEQLADGGVKVEVYEAMPSVGRKFLRAGVGGLNLTHTESREAFLMRYSQPEPVGEWLRQFDPDMLRKWANELGVATFVGSSGRVFPVGLKASPLLRAWLLRLRSKGVIIHARHQWREMVFEDRNSDGFMSHCFQTPAGIKTVRTSAAVLALGGGSWSRLGSDGRWLEPLAKAGVGITPLGPSNCGFNYQWSALLREKFAGQPLKSVELTVQNASKSWARKGEALISQYGVQGSLIYAASHCINAEIQLHGFARLCWDLFPDRALDQLVQMLGENRGKLSLSNYLRKRLGLKGVRLALFHELGTYKGQKPELIARQLKNLCHAVRTPRPLDEAISTTGGVMLNELDAALMSQQHPGLFMAGEMLDWDAPTGGYLLTAALASGRVAGLGARDFLACAR
jgi:uncharacterized flavoprotein (TIGR03862 family)